MTKESTNPSTRQPTTKTAPSVVVPERKERADGSTIPPTVVVHSHPIDYPTVNPKTGRAGK